MRYKYERTITDEEIVDLMDTALHGIAYWCGEAQVLDKNGKTFDGWTSEALSSGHDIRLWDTEKWHTLTLDKLLKGLSMRTSFDSEQYDADDGDAIIQYAIFGEIVYA